MELVGQDSVYWRWHSDGSAVEWGWKLTITACMPGTPSAEKLLVELSNAGGVGPLLSFTSLPDQALRAQASQALTTLSGLEVARKEIDRQNGMEPLLQSLSRLQFKALEAVPVHPSERECEAGVRATIPPGRVIAIDSQVWRETDAAKAEPSSSGGRAGSCYRAHVAYPKELEGWVSLQPGSFQPVPVERNTLVLLALLSLEPNNREKLVEQGKLKLLLQLAGLDDPVCKRVAAIALDEIADRPDKVRGTHLDPAVAKALKYLQCVWFCAYAWWWSVGSRRLGAGAGAAAAGAARRPALPQLTHARGHGRGR